MTITISVSVDRLPEIIKRLPGAAGQALGGVSQGIARDAASRSRVDTGKMRDGWTAEQVSELEWDVTNPVPYTTFNELGTVHMPAQPMLAPACAAAESALSAAFSRLESLL